MTKENYFNLLKNCDIVVMNHLRQQGAGNINCMLSMGAKVFLNSTSPLYEFYLNQGANVFDTKKIDLEMLSKPLSSEQRIQNKKVINMHFSSTAISKKTRRFLSLLKSTISSNF